MKSSHQNVLLVGALLLGCATVALVPLKKTSSLFLISPPQYPAKLTLVSESKTTDLLTLDTQGMPVTTAKIGLSYFGPTPEPLSGCFSFTSLVFHCTFNQTAQQQLIPLLRFVHSAGSIQILPGSSVYSNGNERLRQFPILNIKQ